MSDQTIDFGIGGEGEHRAVFVLGADRDTAFPEEILVSGELVATVTANPSRHLWIEGEVLMVEAENGEAVYGGRHRAEGDGDRSVYRFYRQDATLDQPIPEDDWGDR